MLRCKRCGEQIYNAENPSLYCDNCEKDNNKINKLTNIGHTRHCACRITFGDGQCECDCNSTNTKQEKRDRINKLFNVIKADI